MTMRDSMTTTTSSALAVAREMRGVDLTPARLGREGWRATLRDELRRRRSRTAEATSRRRAASAAGMQDLAELVEAYGRRWRAGWTPEELDAIETANPPHSAEPECERCGGARAVLITRDRRHPMWGRSVPCACVPPAELAAAAKVPPAYFEAMTFEAFARSQNPEALAVAEEWRARENLVLAGPPGRGKTHLAVAMLIAALRRGRGGRFVHVPDLIGDLRRRFGPDAGENAEDYFDAITSAPVLLLDELGGEQVDSRTGQPTAYTAERISTLIDRRMRYGESTLVTTNLVSLREVADRYGARVASRLGGWRWVQLEGPDFRLLASAARRAASS